ncbi:MAG: hypothetical protein AABZ53_13240 [Planctomycetota bacterium]
MWTEILVISAIFLVLSVVAILVWWKLADQWVDDEHKRFKRGAPEDQPPKIVIRTDELDAKP